MFDPHAPVEIVTLRDERASDVEAIGRVIVAAFEGEPQHGQFERQIVVALRADGAFTIGIKVGRRSLDVLAMDFVGNVCSRDVFEYTYPDPAMLFPALEARLARTRAALGARAKKVVGVGVAAPLWLGGWRDFLGAPPEALEAWNDIDIRARIETMSGLPVEFAKDTTAACAAELVMGQGRGIHNFLYLFVGTFMGGGLVIDGRLHGGPHGNAGAVGSIPLARTGTKPARQLLHAASGFVLERIFAEAGAPPSGPAFPALDEARGWFGPDTAVQTVTLGERHASGLAFLRAMGASGTDAAETRTQAAGTMRRAMRAFEAGGGKITYQVLIAVERI